MNKFEKMIKSKKGKEKKIFKKNLVKDICNLLPHKDILTIRTLQMVSEVTEFYKDKENMINDLDNEYNNN